MRISHLSCAHALWSNIVSPYDVVVDATLGNGHDALFLARCLKGKGTLLGYDIQKKAIDSSSLLFSANPELTKELDVKFYLTSHEELDALFPSLIVYNLGYLPRGDKTVTTSFQTTKKSIERAISLIKPGGVISITSYPGHDEGKIELEHLMTFFANPPKGWKSFSFRSANPNAPVLFLFQKELTPLASKKSYQESLPCHQKVLLVP